MSGLFHGTDSAADVSSSSSSISLDDEDPYENESRHRPLPPLFGLQKHETPSCGHRNRLHQSSWA
jgi:hypothetical protein